MSMLESIVGRLHVGSSDLSVVRAVRASFKPKSRRDPKLRGARKEAYREALRIHSRNRETYAAVVSGQFGRVRRPGALRIPKPKPAPGAKWYRAARGQYHVDGGEWVSSGRFYCGRTMVRAAFTWTGTLPSCDARFCRRCLKGFAR